MVFRPGTRSASARGYEDKYGSNATMAKRAAWKKTIIMNAAARNARRPVARSEPTAPIANAAAAIPSGGRRYANDWIVRSAMWPSDRV